MQERGEPGGVAPGALDGVHLPGRGAGVPRRARGTSRATCGPSGMSPSSEPGATSVCSRPCAWAPCLLCRRSWRLPVGGTVAMCFDEFGDHAPPPPSTSSRTKLFCWAVYSVLPLGWAGGASPLSASARSMSPGVRPSPSMGTSSTP